MQGNEDVVKLFPRVLHEPGRDQGFQGGRVQTPRARVCVVWSLKFRRRVRGVDQRLPPSFLGQRDRDVAILALEHRRRRETGFLANDVGNCLHAGNVHQLTLPGRIAVRQRQHNSGGSGPPAQVHCLLAGEFEGRLSVGIGYCVCRSLVTKASHVPRNQLTALEVPIRAGLPERTDGCHHEPRVHGGQRLELQVAVPQIRRTVVCDENVRFSNESQQGS